MAVAGALVFHKHNLFFFFSVAQLPNFLNNLKRKDSYLDFSHLTELKNIYITEIYILFTDHQKLRIKKIQKKNGGGFP